MAIAKAAEDSCREAARDWCLELLRVAYWPPSGEALDAEIWRLENEPLHGESFLIEGRRPARDDLDSDDLGRLDLASTAVDDLADEPLTLYRPLAEGYVYPIGWYQLADAEGDSGASLGMLRKALTRWAARWRVGTDWCLQAALGALWQWHTDSVSLQHRFWGRPWVSYTQWVADFEVTSWASMEAPRRRPGARRPAATAPDTRFSGAFRGRRDRAWAPGPPLKRPRFPEPFIWLVRFQVLGERVQDIAAATGRDPNTVRRGIKELATLLELPLSQSSSPSRSRSRTRTRPRS
jgi:hypothetical protein